MPVDSTCQINLTNKQKMVLLTGAAALYYMYQKQRDAQGRPVQYYKSESTGRIYYRDPKTKRAIWVTPPQAGIAIPAQQAGAFNQYQGYNGSAIGKAFGGVGGKMALLTGAAALYYLYKNRRDAQGNKVQYYRSESTDRIYYRDPKTKRAIWVTPPKEGIHVPANAASAYARYQGYNGAPTGESFGGYGAAYADAGVSVPVPVPAR